VFQDKGDTCVLLVGFDPLLEDTGMLITGVVQMEYERGGVGVFALDLLQQFDDFGGRNGAAGLAQVDVFLVLGTIGPQNVEPFAAAAYANIKALSTQKPAAVDGFQAPDGMAGVDKVASFFSPGLGRLALYFLTNSSCLSRLALKRKPVIWW